MRTRIALLPVMVAMGALALVPSVAQGYVKVAGSSLASAPNSYLCSGQINGCTLAIQDLQASAGTPWAPIDGVVIAWAIRSLPTGTSYPIRLHLIRGTASAAVGPEESMPTAGGVHTFQARLPIKAGDQLGVDFEPPPFIDVGIAKSGVNGSYDLWEPVLGASEVRAPTEDGKPNYELMITATIDPDFDNDGWGDESQDKCPGAVGPAEGCPIAGPPLLPTEPVPNTKVNEVRVEGSKAILRFSATVKGAKFGCRLNRNPWKSCKSPKVYRGLKEGRYSFKVKAIGPTAVPDPTPARRTFRVEL